MKILLTNDDGIQGEGIQVLAAALRGRGHEVFIVAPKENNSAVSHKIHMRVAMSLEKRAENVYVLGGTPADCVLVALHYLNYQPELVLSGINMGQNVGSDVIYSGTVAGAIEGAQNEIPSIAFSQYLRTDFTAEETGAALKRAAELAAENLADWAELAKKTGAVNVNFPLREPLGIRFCKQAHTYYNTSYAMTEDGLKMQFNPPVAASEGDIPSLRAGYITFTPLKIDMTDYEALEKWEKRS